MSRQLFPFLLLGGSAGDTPLGAGVPPVEVVKDAATRGPVIARDFRPNSPHNRGDKPASKAVPDEAPKASSATDAATSSPNESQASLVDLEALRAYVEKESKAPVSSDGDLETKTDGSSEPPALASIPPAPLL